MQRIRRYSAFPALDSGKGVNESGGCWNCPGRGIPICESRGPSARPARCIGPACCTSLAAIGQQREDFLGHCGLADPGEDLGDAVLVGIGIAVAAGVGGNGDVIAVLVGGAGGGFDADAGLG